jgi:hypothetical protein
MLPYRSAAAGCATLQDRSDAMVRAVSVFIASETIHQNGAFGFQFCGGASRNPAPRRQYLAALDELTRGQGQYPVLTQPIFLQKDSSEAEARVVERKYVVKGFLAVQEWNEGGIQIGVALDWRRRLAKRWEAEGAGRLWCGGGGRV